MPRIQLSEKEYEELTSSAEAPSDENTMDDSEYLEARDKLIARAQADGDDDLVDELLERFPHPGKLEEQEREEMSRQHAEEERESRRPKSREDFAKFHADLDRVPDGDKHAMRETLRRHGMLQVEEDGVESHTPGYATTEGWRGGA